MLAPVTQFTTSAQYSANSPVDQLAEARAALGRAGMYAEPGVSVARSIEELAGVLRVVRAHVQEQDAQVAQHKATMGELAVALDQLVDGVRSTVQKMNSARPSEASLRSVGRDLRAAIECLAEMKGCLMLAAGEPGRVVHVQDGVPEEFSEQTGGQSPSLRLESPGAAAGSGATGPAANATECIHGFLTRGHCSYCEHADRPRDLGGHLLDLGVRLAMAQADEARGLAEAIEAARAPK